MAIPDATSTPGNATQNGPKGRAAVANAASAVTITNSEVDANSFVNITWEDQPTGVHRVSYAAGSFTVTLPSAVGATTKFRWLLVK